MAMGIKVNKSEEAIEGESYAVLFDAARTPDPEESSVRERERECVCVCEHTMHYIMHALCITPLQALWSNQWNASFTQYPRCAKAGSKYTNGTETRCAKVKKEDFKYMGYSIR
jgi:hypothetical protein